MFHGHHHYGVIGGPDGPTVVFIAQYGSVKMALALFVLLALAAGIIWYFRRRRGR